MNHELKEREKERISFRAILTTYQVASEGFLDDDGGLDLALLAAVARPHLRQQLPGCDGGHGGGPAAGVSHAVPRLREAPPPPLRRRRRAQPETTAAGARGGVVCLAIPVRFLLAAGEHLPEPSHRAAHVPRSCCRNGRMRQKEKQALNGWMQMQGSNETTETELVLQRGNSREINSGFLESY